MGKNYLIVGASSGIGEACARRLAGEDTTLFIVARREDRLKALAEELSGNIIPIVYDLHDIDGIGSIFKVCSEREIKLDGMVFSAGIDGLWPIKVNNISKMREVMEVNCFSFVELGKNFFSKRCSNDGASIVAISSVASKSTPKGMLAYSMSKAAVDVAVKTMAKEFVSRKIRVNAILPGGVDTQMAAEKGALVEGLSDKGVDDAQPFGLIPAESIADSVYYLVSEDSAYVTGSLLTVSGGRV